MSSINKLKKTTKIKVGKMFLKATKNKSLVYYQPIWVANDLVEDVKAHLESIATEVIEREAKYNRLLLSESASRFKFALLDEEKKKTGKVSELDTKGTKFFTCGKDDKFILAVSEYENKTCIVTYTV